MRAPDRDVPMEPERGCGRGAAGTGTWGEAEPRSLAALPGASLPPRAPFRLQPGKGAGGKALLPPALAEPRGQDPALVPVAGVKEGARSAGTNPAPPAPRPPHEVQFALKLCTRACFAHTRIYIYTYILITYTYIYIHTRTPHTSPPPRAQP